MTKEKRQYLPSMAELIDRTTVDTIKMAVVTNQECTKKELDMLLNDIDLLIKERDVQLSSRLICSIIILAQMNLHIWKAKDRLDNATPEEYADELKYSHQLNGFRNRVKNFLLALLQDTERGAQWSNDSTDGLDDWIGGLLNYENETTR